MRDFKECLKMVIEEHKEESDLSKDKIDKNINGKNEILAYVYLGKNNVAELMEAV